MDNSTWIVLWLLFLCAFLLLKNRKQNWAVQYVKMKKRGEGIDMTEAVKKLIGRECCFYLLSGEVAGLVREVEGRSAVVETKTDTQVVNLDFVMRIREIPEKKRRKNND